VEGSERRYVCDDPIVLGKPRESWGHYQVVDVIANFFAMVARPSVLIEVAHFAEPTVTKPSFACPV
jgi:hypothetical protein